MSSRAAVFRRQYELLSLLYCLVMMVTVFQCSFCLPLVLSWTVTEFPSRSVGKIPKSVLCSKNTEEESDIRQPSKESELFQMLLPNPTCNPTQMSPTSLAYIGDSVFEMFVRSRYVWPSRRTTDLQNLVVAKVRAETQSKLYQSMLVSFELTERERSILSRGRNAGSPSGGRRSRGPKRLYKSQTNGGQGPGAYQDSTALEALIGYSYLTDQGRCGEVLNFLSQELDVMDDDDGVIR